MVAFSGEVCEFKLPVKCFWKKKILTQVTKGKFYIKKTSQFMYDSTHHVQFSCIGSSRDPTSPHRHEIVIAVLHISFKSLRSLKLCRND